MSEFGVAMVSQQLDAESIAFDTLANHALVLEPIARLRLHTA
jgi:hypothetical protein